MLSSSFTTSPRPARPPLLPAPRNYGAAAIGMPFNFLHEGGVTLPSAEAGADERSAQLREKWDPTLRTLAQQMVHPWPEVDRAMDRLG